MSACVADGAAPVAPSLPRPCCSTYPSTYPCCPKKNRARPRCSSACLILSALQRSPTAAITTARTHAQNRYICNATGRKVVSLTLASNESDSNINTFGGVRMMMLLLLLLLVCCCCCSSIRLNICCRCVRNATKVQTHELFTSSPSARPLPADADSLTSAPTRPPCWTRSLRGSTYPAPSGTSTPVRRVKKCVRAMQTTERMRACLCVCAVDLLLTLLLSLLLLPRRRRSRCCRRRLPRCYRRSLSHCYRRSLSHCCCHHCRL